jgi:hypothetical protein
MRQEFLCFLDDLNSRIVMKLPKLEFIAMEKIATIQGQLQKPRSTGYEVNLGSTLASLCINLFPNFPRTGGDS